MHLTRGDLPFPTETLTSALAPRVVPAKNFDEFIDENRIGDIEKTIFHLLLTYTTLDELVRVGILLQHLHGAAVELEKQRADEKCATDHCQANMQAAN
jgi:hypothetical protein